MKKINPLFLLPVLILIFVGVLFLTKEDGEAETDIELEISESQAEVIDEKEINQMKIERVWGVKSPDFDASSVYSIYYDKESGETEILFSRGRRKELPIASITKLLTALLVYENHDVNDFIQVSDSALGNGYLSDLRIFSETTYVDILHSLLLESNNSSAHLMATSSINQNYDDFISLMNRRAKEIGMRQSYFYNPSGLDSIRGTNFSTANDVAFLIKELLEVPLFWKIMQETQYDIKSRQSDLYYRVNTTNRFLNGIHFASNTPKWYHKIIGGKTGFTFEAMGCFVVVLEIEKNQSYIINVVLGANGIAERFDVMENLINWLHEAYII